MAGAETGKESVGKRGRSSQEPGFHSRCGKVPSAWGSGGCYLGERQDLIEVLKDLYLVAVWRMNCRGQGEHQATVVIQVRGQWLELGVTVADKVGTVWGQLI